MWRVFRFKTIKSGENGLESRQGKEIGGKALPWILLKNTDQKWEDLVRYIIQ